MALASLGATRVRGSVSYTHLDVYKRQLLILVPDQWPTEQLAPEVARLRHAVTGDAADPGGVRQEAAAALDHAELVVLGVPEDNVPLVPALS